MRCGREDGRKEVVGRTECTCVRFIIALVEGVVVSSLTRIG